MAGHKLKLIASIAVVLVLGFLVTSFSSYFVSRSSLRLEISQNELPLTSDNIYSEIQHDLLRPIFISSLMASDTFLRDWVLGGEADPRQISKYLQEIRTRYNTFSSFFVSEKTRNYYHGAGIVKKVAPDESRDAWYFRVRAMANDYEINIDPDLTNQDAMTIFINYKVFDYNRRFIGATGVGLTVSAVSDLIEIYQNKYHRTIYFMDGNGDIKIAGSNFDQTIKNISQLTSLPQLKEMLASGGDQSFSYKREGQVHHTNIRYIDEFQWFLVVEQSEQKAIEHILTTLLLNLFICGVTVIVVLILVNFSVTAYQERIETLRGIVPICSFCKQIRDDQGYWNRVEAYVAKYTDVQFSHSVCPTCLAEHYPDESAAMAREDGGQ